jgi:FKBP12-rapamycin complex-associated protein
MLKYMHCHGPQACLVLVEQRETRYRVQWYHKLFESTQRGLAGAQSTEVVHGSMLALGELLRHTGELHLTKLGAVAA